ncbi:MULTISPECIES: hypothetical protein [Streptococcus]
MCANYRGKSTGSLSFSIPKRLRKGVYLSCGKRKELRQVFSSMQ